MVAVCMVSFNVQYVCAFKCDMYLAWTVQSRNFFLSYLTSTVWVEHLMWFLPCYIYACHLYFLYALCLFFCFSCFFFFLHRFLCVCTILIHLFISLVPFCCNFLILCSVNYSMYPNFPLCTLGKYWLHFNKAATLFQYSQFLPSFFVLWSSYL
jgi:hypothetical protein